ncbi:MAG TPA: inositol monophosphatase [Chloroflexi bacterium]|nr:inositol monophosphatase [Chloroflexota bacterium]
MKPTLAEIETWARGAGEILLSGLGQKIQIDHKSEIDLVTEIDRRSEDFLLKAIRQNYPNDRIVAEESGILQGSNGHVWHIDPLDGTVNYAHGIPFFSVSIGYEEDDGLRLGVVYDPVRDELYSAERGQGAFLNGKPLQVSWADRLIRSLLVTGFPYDIQKIRENNLDHYANFSLVSQGVRRLGSAALDLCYVAAGRLEGFWEIQIQSYDIAAGALIVEEAGGMVTDVRGGPGYLTPPCSVLASNGQLHQAMLEVLWPAQK